MEEDINLTDEQAEGILREMVLVMQKYVGRTDTFETINALSNEVIGRCEKNLGLIVSVNVFDEMGRMNINKHGALEPIVTVEGVVEEFDPDRQEWQVKNKVADETRINTLLSKGEVKGKKAKG